jgi:hypothetical protein
MNKNQVILSTVLLVLFLRVLTSQDALDVPTGAENSDRLRHQFAVSLLRTMNTAEAVEHSTYGSYARWQTLVAHHAEYFGQFIALHRRQLPDAHFADSLEIVPGWNLRMNMHADGQGYEVLLEDMTDKKCGYAAVTNENAVIRQSKTINCDV